MSEDIEHLKNVNHALQQSIDDLNSLREISQKILTCHSAEEITDTLAKSLKGIIHTEKSEVYLYNDELETFEPTSAPNSMLKPENELIEWTLQGNKVSTIPVDQFLITLIPLKIRDIKIGVICADTTNSIESINQTVMDMLMAISTQASAAFLSSRLLNRTQIQANLLNNILDSIINGILTVDKNNLITRVNLNAMAMLEVPSDAMGRDYRQALSQQITIIMEELIEETSKTGFAMERMINFNNSQGIEIPLAVSTSLLRDESLSITGIVFVFRDMTASRELDRLRQIDRMKTELISNVSHELKTPLTSIKAYTEALQDMAQDDTQKEFLKVIQEESDRLLFLINDLLSVSRLQSGKMKIKFGLADPTSIITEILKISKVQSQKHKVIFEPPEKLPQIYMDKDMMKEVMINLVGNAIKYSPNGGNVTIRIKKIEDTLQYEVQDQGMGISEENLAKVFDPFYRVDSSLTYEIPGTGLGLAIVKEIINAHSGKIELESTVGVGSTFRVIIPAKTSDAELSPEEESWTE